MTPGVLAEVSDLGMELKDDGFSKLVEANMSAPMELGESHVAKDVMLANPTPGRLGVTDVSILVAAREAKGEILTNDHHLWQRSMRDGVDATHMMELQSRAEFFLEERK